MERMRQVPTVDRPHRREYSAELKDGAGTHPPGGSIGGSSVTQPRSELADGAPMDARRRAPSSADSSRRRWSMTRPGCKSSCGTSRDSPLRQPRARPRPSLPGAPATARSPLPSRVPPRARGHVLPALALDVSSETQVIAPMLDQGARVTGRRQKKCCSIRILRR